jgi:ribosomal protein S3
MFKHKILKSLASNNELAIVSKSSDKSIIYNKTRYYAPYNNIWGDKTYFYNKSLNKNAYTHNANARSIILNYFNMLSFGNKSKSEIFLYFEKRFASIHKALSERKIILNKNLSIKNDKLRKYSRKDNLLKLRYKLLYSFVYKRFMKWPKIWISSPLIKHNNTLTTITLHMYNKDYNAKYQRLGLNRNNLFCDRNTVQYLKENHDTAGLLLERKSLASPHTLRRLKLKNKKINQNIKDKIKKEINVLNIKYKFLRKLKSTIRYLSLAIILQTRFLVNTHSFIDSSLMNKMSLLEKTFITRCVKNLLLREKFILRRKKKFFLNKFKFNSVNIEALKRILERVYDYKKIDLNIINLNSPIYNSEIFIQKLVLPLSKRKVPKKAIFRSLRDLKAPLTKRLEYMDMKPEAFTLGNLSVKSLLNSHYFYSKAFIKNNLRDHLGKDLDLSPKTNTIYHEVTKLYKISGDKLNLILKSYFNKGYTNLKEEVSERNAEKHMLDNTKYKNVIGIRVKASGRLSKRIIAARSVNFIRNKGPVKSLEASYKNISVPLIRDKLPANIQYSSIGDNCAIGSFGVKGWVSSA